MKGMRYSFNNDKEELKNTKWLAELLKAGIISIITATILFFARQYSPGNKTGKDLQIYLKERVCSELEIPLYNMTEILNPYNGSYETLSDSNVLITYGEYINTTGEQGRVVALFERKKEGLWNKIVGSFPSYDIVFARNIEVGVQEKNLYYTGVDVRDIDANGISDIFLSLQSNFATRISHIELLICKIDDKWKIVSPPSAVINDIKKDINNKGYSLYYDEYELINPSDKKGSDIVYGLSHDGLVYIVKNPLLGGIDLCYEIALNDGTIGSSLNTHYAYAMMKFNDGKLSMDENWNGGDILILEGDKNFLEEKDLHWGYMKTEHFQFYGDFW